MGSLSPLYIIDPGMKKENKTKQNKKKKKKKTKNDLAILCDYTF